MIFVGTRTERFNRKTNCSECYIPDVYLIRVKDNITGEVFLDKTQNSTNPLTKKTLTLAENRVNSEMADAKLFHDKGHYEGDLTIDIIKVGNACTTIEVVKTFHFVNGTCVSKS